MEDAHNYVLAFAILFFATTWLTVGLRVYVRGFLIKAVGADDYTILGALLCYTAYLICQFGGVAHGTGRHIQDISPADAQIALRYWYFCEVFYAPSTTLLKVSVGLFLLRIAIHKVQRYIIYTFITGSILFGTFYFFLIIFQCSPVSFWWDLNPEHHGKCISPAAFEVCGYLVSVLNAAADLTFAILPGVIIWGTSMNLRTRIVVCSLLGFASVACIATIVRIPYVHTLDIYKGDFLWNTWQVAVLSTVEVGLGITAACAATFRPLVQTWLGTSRSGTYSASGGRKSKTKMTGFAGIKSQTVVTQTKGVMLDSLDKALAGQGTIVTTITGRESFTHLPDLVLMEQDEEGELDEESLVRKNDRVHRG